MHIGGDLVGAEVRASAVGDSEEVAAATGATWVVVAMGAIWAAVEVLAVPDSVWAEEVEAAGAVPQWAAEGVDLGVAVEQRWAAVVEAVAVEEPVGAPVAVEPAAVAAELVAVELVAVVVELVAEAAELVGAAVEVVGPISD